MMPSQAEYQRRHRQRFRDEGKTEILLKLPKEDVALLDHLREVQGAANRSDVVVSLIRQLTEAGNELKNA
jgi:metal-responsive CopG/Arc/MetJ family transcriptional regulator